MFNSAKSSTFVVEVQSLLDQASTQFMTEAIKPANQGKNITFDANENGEIRAKANIQQFGIPVVNNDVYLGLKMSGNTKKYIISIDKNGNILKVVVLIKISVITKQVQQMLQLPRLL